MVAAIQPRPPESSTPSRYPTSRVGILVRAEIHLREAGRALECSVDPELARLSKVVFRLAQRVAVDGGRLERVA